MKKYVQPELILGEILSNVDILQVSNVDLTEKDYFDFGSSNPWGGD